MKNVIYALIIGILFLCNISFGGTNDGTNDGSITLDKTDLLISAFFFLGSLIAFAMGGAHEWHLTLQDLRIEEGTLTNTQRHQLLAGFKNNASVWSGIIGLFAAIMTASVEKFSETISFATILSSILILIGPYLAGRLMYIFYLHGAEYRKRRTTASKNYVPIYFANLSMEVAVVNYYSVTEFLYLLAGYIVGQSGIYLYCNLSIKLLTALLVTNLIDQAIILVNLLKVIDRSPAQIARVSPGVARILGYSDMVDSLKNLQIDKNGVINMDMDGLDMEVIIGQGQEGKKR